MTRRQFNGVYRGKKVLITGHTGFKGSWLSLWLSKLGAKVVGYSVDVPTKPGHFTLLDLDIQSYSGNILDRAKLIRTLKKERPDIIFHLAAQSLVRESYINPLNTFETNVFGTLNVLEACRLTGNTRAVVNITSDKCYRNDESGKAFIEDDALGGNDPYSASKACSELLSQAYRKSFFGSQILLANVRAGNVIGGGDWAKDRLVPDIIRATSKKECVMVRNPKAVRPWQHVLDPLSGYLMIGQRLLDGQVDIADNWNFGPNKKGTLTVLEIIEMMKKQWPVLNYQVNPDVSGSHEAKLLSLDSSKARKELGWLGIWDARKAVSLTAEWYKEYYNSGKIKSFENLDTYINDARLASANWLV